MNYIQELMGEQNMVQPARVDHITSKLTIPKFVYMPNCFMEHYEYLKFVCTRRHNTKANFLKYLKSKASCHGEIMILDFSSLYKFVEKTPESLFSAYNRDDANHQFHGFTIYNNSATGIILGKYRVS